MMSSGTVSALAPVLGLEGSEVDPGGLGRGFAGGLADHVAKVEKGLVESEEGPEDGTIVLPEKGDDEGDQECDGEGVRSAGTEELAQALDFGIGPALGGDAVLDVIAGEQCDSVAADHERKGSPYPKPEDAVVRVFVSEGGELGEEAAGRDEAAEAADGRGLHRRKMNGGEVDAARHRVPSG